MRNKDMSIAYLADGRSVHTKRWLEYFSSRGYAVHLITYKQTKIRNVAVHKVATARVQFPFRIFQAIRVIKTIKPDILHAFYITNNGLIGALSGFHPLVLSAWGSDISVDPEKSWIFRLMVTFALKRADLVQTGDNVGKKRLIELGCSVEKIFMQHEGVDTQRFSPRARSEILRRKLKIDNEYSVILARRWTPTYNVDVFVRAMPLVLRKIPNVKFIMLGGGRLERRLRELARELGVYKNAIFVGKVPHEQMPEYLASVDLYVDTSSDYRIAPLGSYLIGRGGSGMGQTTREVMACGTPQIIPDRKSFTSANWFQGLTYRQLDYKHLAERIIAMLNNKKLRKRIGEKSREVVLEICDLEKNMKKWEAIYCRLKTSTKP